MLRQSSPQSPGVKIAAQRMSSSSSSTSSPSTISMESSSLPHPPVPVPSSRISPSNVTPNTNNASSNGKQFHSISLLSPVDRPVVLSFDDLPPLGNGASAVGIQAKNGAVGSNCCGSVKSGAEGDSRGQLICPDASSSSAGKLPALLRPLARLLASRRFLLLLVLLLSVLALLLVLSLVLMVILLASQSNRQEEDAAFLNRDSNWRDSCSRQCTARFDVPPLLLISMDGFRADYLMRESATRAISRIMQCGARVPFMSPSYPSKTFPNHYSIVTGLYPESHGIVDNHFYDEQMPEQKHFAKSSRNPAWYNGEPIWNTVTKNGKKSAIFFWPGSEVPIQGMLPTYRYNYNASLPFSKRVDQVIDWLRLEETDRPAFLAMYFEQPDTAMHREGPDSDAVNSALIYVDAMVNYLMQQLDNNGFLGCINLVILSDHGAQKLREDHFIALDQFVNAKDPNVGGVFGGAIGHINFRNFASPSFVNRVLEPMTCLGGQPFRVYTRQSMPKRYHYTKSGRIGEIVIDSVGGTRLFVDQKSLRELGPLEKGDHGYDNRMREMRAIFGAWGPSIKRGHVEKPFQNIELYNLFTALMELPVTAPNNGTQGRLHSLLRQPPPVEPTAMVELEECEGARLVKCGDGCHFELNYQSESVSVSSEPSSPSAAASQSGAIDGGNSPSAATARVPVYSARDCKYASRISVPAQLGGDKDNNQMCTIRLCNATLVFNRRIGVANFVESQLTAPVPNIDHRANCTAHFVIPRHQPRGKGPVAGESKEQQSIDGENTENAQAIDGNGNGVEEETRNGGKISRRSIDEEVGETGGSAPLPRAAAAVVDETTSWENTSRQQQEDMSQESGRERQISGEAEEGEDEKEGQKGHQDDGTLAGGGNPPSVEQQMPVPAVTPAASTTTSTGSSTTTQSFAQRECARVNGERAGGNGTNGSGGSSASWISLFPDNDYARYVWQGQFRVPAGFYNGPWKQVLSLLRQYVQHYKRLLMWAGPVFDHNFDGLADPLVVPPPPADEPKQQQQNGEPLLLGPPSHIFLILLRCPNGQWQSGGRHCQQPENSTTLAFVLPLVERDLNCLFPVEYIFRHTAKIRDIELLTGNEWFSERDIYSPELAIQLRTYLNEQLWQLEVEPKN